MTLLAEIPPPWRPLWLALNGYPTVGAPGVRDPDAPCDAFEPVGAPFARAPGTGDCSTDGHYMCDECVRMSAEASAWRSEP